eukprot:scaffold291_cov168-Amphora_coffeaeformis.AAC.2
MVSKNVATVLVLISISFLCASQFLIGFQDSVAASGQTKNLSFYGSWRQDAHEDDADDEEDDDDDSVPYDASDTTNNYKNVDANHGRMALQLTQTGKKKKKKKHTNNNDTTKKHWRMLKRKHDFMNDETDEIVADISDFIDFAIIGNPKTGTTFLAEWLNQHADLYLPDREMRHFMEPNGPGLLVRQFMHLYRRKRGNKQLGYKCPADVREMQSLIHLRNHFPKTKLIVGGSALNVFGNCLTGRINVTYECLNTKTTASSLFLFRCKDSGIQCYGSRWVEQRTRLSQQLTRLF